MPVDRLSPTAMLGRRAFWLVEVDLGGDRLRLSTAELDIVDGDDILHFHGVLDEVEVSEAIRLFEDSSGSSEVSVSAVLPVDVPRRLALGTQLAMARAWVSRWIEDTTYDSRRVVLAGLVRDPEHGAAWEPTSFTIAENVWEDKALVPSSTQRVDGYTWEHADTIAAENLGKVYPIIIGRPGRVSTAVSSSGRVTGSQACVVWSDQTSDGGSGNYNVMWVVAGHHVSATRAYVNCDDWTTPARVRVMNALDGRGQPVAVIPWWVYDTYNPPYPYEWTAAHGGGYTIGADTDGNPTYGAGSAVGPSAGADPDVIDLLQADTPPPIFVAWMDDINGDDVGGLTLDGKVVREAGDVLEYLLGRTTIPVDLGRMAAVKPLLSTFKFDFALDARCSPWEFIRANLLPLLPVSVVSGQNGVYVVAWRYDATEADAVAHLDVDNPYVERSSAISIDTSKLRNDFTMDYAKSIRVGTYSARERLWSGIPAVGVETIGDATDETIFSSEKLSLHCYESQRRYRDSSGRPLVAEHAIETFCVYDSGTATAILAWMARAFALAQRRVTYLAPEAPFAHVDRGDVITVTDPNVYLRRQVALVEEVRHDADGAGRISLSLLLIEDPARDARYGQVA